LEEAAEPMGRLGGALDKVEQLSAFGFVLELVAQPGDPATVVRQLGEGAVALRHRVADLLRPREDRAILVARGFQKALALGPVVRAVANKVPGPERPHLVWGVDTRRDPRIALLARRDLVVAGPADDRGFFREPVRLQRELHQLRARALVLVSVEIAGPQAN